MHRASTSRLPKFITSLLAVFALVVSGLSLQVFPASAASLNGCQSSNFQPNDCKSLLTPIADINEPISSAATTSATATATCASTWNFTLYLDASGTLTAVTSAAGLNFSSASNVATLAGTTQNSAFSTANYIIYAKCGTSLQSAYGFSVTVTATALPALSPLNQTVTGTAGQAITSTVNLTATRFSGPVTYSIAPTLPAGLTMDVTRGAISGTPSAASAQASYTITGEATDISNNVERATVSVSITIEAAAQQQQQSQEPEPPTRKVTICHRTHSETNPYVRITVDYNSVNKKSGHQGHDEIFGGYHVFTAGVYKRAKDKDWGDIIPADPSGLNRWKSLNWTPLGEKIYNGTVAGCPSFDPVKYYNALREAGVPEKKIKQEIADLETEQQEANPGVKKTDPKDIKYTGSNSKVTEEDNDKVTICHRTNSVTNPYRKITVSTSSVTNKAGHMSHDEIYNGHHVFDSTVSYPNNKKDWGDIIPADPTGKNRWQPLNWTPLGQDIYNGKVAGCAEKTTQEIYNELRESGKPKKEIIKDLEEQSNVDDDPKDIDEVEYTGNDPKTEETEPREPKDPNPKAIDQSLSGIVWLDLNKDGLKDANEPLMKGITLSVVQVTFVNPTSVYERNLRTMSMRSTVGIRPAAVVTVQTDANGFYIFPSLGAGDWKVVTGVPTELYVTYDSHESSDGEMTTTVPVGSHAFTWVGLVSEDETVNEKIIAQAVKDNPDAIPVSELPVALQKELKAEAAAKAAAEKKAAAKELAQTGNNELPWLVFGMFLVVSGLAVRLLARTKRRNAQY